MKNWILVVFLFGVSLSTVWSQQGIQYSLYMLNRFNYNPAYAGMDYELSANAVYRKQWVNVPQSPSNASINLHMPLYIARGGIGIQFESDVIGVQQSTLVQLAYNYQLEIGDGILSLGVAGGLLQRSIDGSRIRTPDGIYDEGNGLFDHMDGILPLTEESGQTPTFDAGIYYKSEWLEGGLSVRNLVEPTIGLSTLDIQVTRNYFGTATATIDLGYTLSLQPSVMVRSDLTQTQTELSLIGVYEDKFMLGGSVRGYNTDSFDAIAIIGGWNISESLRLAYAYDVTISNLNNVSNGSHEIMLGYRLNQTIGQGRPPRIIYHPRAF
ncbi:MAG TPA: type IX secretion system membrane protein PorP/SprF [Saprospiraceae bacterium]|nr:type IX secretion system membrane protein PorP/SprF [Saprospiraceae bacterium]